MGRQLSLDRIESCKTLGDGLLVAPASLHQDDGFEDLLAAGNLALLDSNALSWRRCCLRNGDANVSWRGIGWKAGGRARWCSRSSSTIEEIIGIVGGGSSTSLLLSVELAPGLLLFKTLLLKLLLPERIQLGGLASPSQDLSLALALVRLVSGLLLQLSHVRKLGGGRHATMVWIGKHSGCVYMQLDVMERRKSSHS